MDHPRRRHRHEQRKQQEYKTIIAKNNKVYREWKIINIT